MRPTHLSAFALGCALACHGTFASPVQPRPRQDSASSAIITSAAATSSSVSIPAASDASAGAAPPSGVSITATLYQAQVNAYAATPATGTSTPISGCVLATQMASTFTEVWTYSLVAGVSYSTDLLTFTDGLYCQCADGWMAGTVSSFNPEGTEFIFCATGGQDLQTDQPTNAVSTSNPQASALPGDANNPGVSVHSFFFGDRPLLTFLDRSGPMCREYHRHDQRFFSSCWR